MSPRFTLAFDQFVDWVVDCMVPPAVRTVGGIGVLTILASLLVWLLESLQSAFTALYSGFVTVCAFSAAMGVLYVCCRVEQCRSMGKINSFNKALEDRHHLRPLDTTEANVLKEDGWIAAEMEHCYDRVLADSFASLHKEAESLLQ